MVFPEVEAEALAVVELPEVGSIYKEFSMAIKISETGKKAISNTISETEKTTDAEIVPVIVQTSSNYPEVTFSGSLLFMFIVSFIYLLISKFPNTYLLLTIQFFAIITGNWLINISPELKIKLCSKRTISEKVYKRALQAFYEHGLGNTENQVGVLIFVSLLEKKIEIVTDEFLKDKLSQAYLDQLVSQIITEFKEDHIVEGLIKGIKTLGQELTKIAPATKQKNELNNDVILE